MTMLMAPNKSLNWFMIFLTIHVRLSGGEKVGLCNVCLQTNSAACMDEIHFATCHNGQALPTITACPGNRICTGDRQICRLPEEGFTPICYEENCGNCHNANGVFTCLDQTTYGYCFGRSTPYAEAIRSCPPGYVCNSYSPEICVPAATNQPSCLAITTTPTPPNTSETESTEASTVTEPITTTPSSTTSSTSSSSSTSSTSSTTPAPPKDADTYCKEIGMAGYFRTDDPTCQQYLYCYLLSGQYLGWYYYCDGYFNIETLKCQKERPADCEEQTSKLSGLQRQRTKDL